MARKSRKTKQKEELEELLKLQKGFFSAEDINKKAKDVGIATIYRFLADAKKQGEIHAFTCEKKTIYSKQDSLHAHHICEKCARVKHIHFNSIDFLKEEINEDICHIQIEVHGTCRKCKSCVE